MKQVLQYLDKGSTSLKTAPMPNQSPGHVVSLTKYSLISAGTERMLVDFGKSSYLEKARQQPEKVRQFWRR